MAIGSINPAALHRVFSSQMILSVQWNRSSFLVSRLWAQADEVPEHVRILETETINFWPRILE